MPSKKPTTTTTTTTTTSPPPPTGGASPRAKRVRGDVGVDEREEESVRIGVLTLQGAITEHLEKLGKVRGVTAVMVREPKDLEEVDGLVIPGGESTVIGRLASWVGLLEPLREWTKAGKPTWGTCAGMIMMADRCEGQSPQRQELLGGLDVTVRRNYFGSQMGSFTHGVRAPGDDVDFPAVFIRAPAILDVGKGVEVLARIDKYTPTSKEAVDAKGDTSVVVAVRQGSLLATAFHPELTAGEDAPWHERFVEMVREAKKKSKSKGA